MLSEFVLLVKFLVTVVAIERFITSVKPFMHSQVVILYKSLVTVVALQYFFSTSQLDLTSQTE